MMSEYTPVSLETLGHGAAKELFEAELERVMANVIDPNVKAYAMRGVTLDLKIKPRQIDGMIVIDYVITAKSKLASSEGFESRMYVAKKSGKAQAFEQKPQEPLFPDEEENKIRSVK